jgi:hypothetical protein
MSELSAYGIRIFVFERNNPALDGKLCPILYIEW